MHYSAIMLPGIIDFILFWHLVIVDTKVDRQFLSYYLYPNILLDLFQAIDHIINSAAKSNYMSAGQINVPIVFRGPNGAAAGVGAQHSQVTTNTNSVQRIFSFIPKEK